MGRRSQQHMTGQTFDSRVNSAGARRRIEAEIRAKHAKAVIDELLRRRKARVEEAKWVKVPDE